MEWCGAKGSDLEEYLRSKGSMLFFMLELSFRSSLELRKAAFCGVCVRHVEERTVGHKPGCLDWSMCSDVQFPLWSKKGAERFRTDLFNF